MSASDESINRRSSQRRTPRGMPRMECRRGYLGLGPNLAEKLLDISQTGARFLSTTELPAGVEVEVVVISYGRPKPVKVLGAVVRSQAEADGHWIVSIRFDHYIDYATWQQVT
jgi:hypothetical protein